MRDHGTRTRYVYDKCRCDECRAAQRAYDQDRYWNYTRPLIRPCRLPAVGTVRRIRALQAIGWPRHLMAPELGVQTAAAVGLMGRSGTVSRQNAENVQSLYGRWSMRLGPSQRSRLIALRYGWPPPLAWDDIDDPREVPLIGSRKPGAIDEVAIEFCLDGYLPFDRLTKFERREVIRRLTARGLTHSEIALRTGLSHDAADKAKQRAA